MPDRPPILADTITRTGEDAVGRVVVTGSHGGVYAAYLARRAGCRAVIFNDAGVGLDDAGIGGLAWLDALGMAAAAVDHASADIGNASLMFDQGLLSHVNEAARVVGLRPGMRCDLAAILLDDAAAPGGPCPEIEEGRSDLEPEGARRKLVLTDSAGLVVPEDAGHVVVTGSHGALFGGDPANALKADAFLAVFNDAGGGVGTTRLPALEGRGIAAVTVAAASARIGDARSTWQDGTISALNAQAARLGAQQDMHVQALVAIALSVPSIRKSAD